MTWSTYCPCYCISYPLYVTPWFHYRRSLVQSDIRCRNYVVHTPPANIQIHYRYSQTCCTAKSVHAISSCIKPHRKIGFRHVNVDQSYVFGFIEHDLIARRIMGLALAVFFRLLLDLRVCITEGWLIHLSVGHFPAGEVDIVLPFGWDIYVDVRFPENSRQSENAQLNECSRSHDCLKVRERTSPIANHVDINKCQTPPPILKLYSFEFPYHDLCDDYRTIGKDGLWTFPCTVSSPYQIYHYALRPSSLIHPTSLIPPLHHPSVQPSWRDSFRDIA